MSFNQYLNQAWNDHVSNSIKVSQSFETGLELLQNESELSELARLIAHVLGQHLAQWPSGIHWLERLQKHPLAQPQENQSTLIRYLKSLELASGKSDKLAEFSDSEKIRIFCLAASAVSEQNQPEKTKTFFNSAAELAQLGLAKDDPANRGLAVAGNSIASILEEKKDRSNFETELMILAAEVARKYWEIAGTWLNVERAEYRLSQTYLKAGDLKKALEHAQQCIEICVANSAEVLELFYGYEALALVEESRQNPTGIAKALELARKCFDQLSRDDKEFASKTFLPLLQRNGM